MKVTAIWIIDENYIVPAYASICSFLESNNIPIVVVYCSHINVEKNELFFTSLNPSIRFETFDTPVEYLDNPNKRTITNRLARMHYADNNDDEVKLLLDADTLFSNESNQLIEIISSQYLEVVSTIFGVLDAKIAYRDYLYFRTTDEKGRDVVIPHLKQKDIYTYVFGPNWWHHLKGASINNGVIAFYKCKEVVSLWKQFYIRGLSHPNVNPGDDQLPLAAAIHKTSQNVVCLPEKFNSKGKVEGEYVVYHALSSAWKMQLYSAFLKEEGVTDFADIAKKMIPKIPNELIESFIQDFSKTKPYLYIKLDGKFGFKHLYEDIISGIDSGVVVEVGMDKGKSACFMAEMIKDSEKNIVFHSIKTRNEESEQLKPFVQLIDRFNLKKHINIYDSIDDYSLLNKAQNIDFVFLNLENDYAHLYDNLEFWFSKLKQGGVLTGYDYTSQIGLDYGNKCATYEFCEQHNLSLRISYDIFIIEKPTQSITKQSSKLALHESNHPI